jgi:hypothetical protein
LLVSKLFILIKNHPQLERLCSLVPVHETLMPTLSPIAKREAQLKDHSFKVGALSS